MKLATYPTLKGTIRSPFPTWTIQEIEDFILENTVGDIVSNRVFAIIDKRTLVDDSIILGQISNDHKNPRLDIVRLSPMHLNADAISVELGLMTVKELIMIEAGRDGAQSPSDLYRRGSARRV